MRCELERPSTACVTEVALAAWQARCATIAQSSHRQCEVKRRGIAFTVSSQHLIDEVRKLRPGCPVTRENRTKVVGVDRAREQLPVTGERGIESHSSSAVLSEI